MAGRHPSSGSESAWLVRDLVDMADRERLIRAKVPELVTLGASVVREEHYEGALGHVVMLDPEGNEFCVA